MFFIPCDNWKTLFFIKVFHYSKGFSNYHIVAFFETTVFKEVRILHYNISTITVQPLYQGSKINLLYIILVKFSQSKIAKVVKLVQVHNPLQMTSFKRSSKTL